MPLPGWVYVLTCPTFPGCCKIGGTGRTATHRAAELVNEYQTGQPFELVERIPVADWPAVEASAHRMLSDRRVPRSELFRVSPAEAVRVVKAAARAYERPSLWRVLLQPRARQRPYAARWRRSRHDPATGVIVLALLLLAVGVAVLKPAPPSWLPVSIGNAVRLLERM